MQEDDEWYVRLSFSPLQIGEAIGSTGPNLEDTASFGFSPLQIGEAIGSTVVESDVATTYSFSPLQIGEAIGSLAKLLIARHLWTVSVPFRSGRPLVQTGITGAWLGFQVSVPFRSGRPLVRWPGDSHGLSQGGFSPLQIGEAIGSSAQSPVTSPPPCFSPLQIGEAIGSRAGWACREANPRSFSPLQIGEAIGSKAKTLADRQNVSFSPLQIGEAIGSGPQTRTLLGP